MLATYSKIFSILCNINHDYFSHLNSLFYIYYTNKKFKKVKNKQNLLTASYHLLIIDINLTRVEGNNVI